jgi:predicted DNA-binding protein
MHRTQIILENKQYQLLKKLSEEKNKSISQVVREIIESYSKKTGVFSLSDMAGIAEDSETYGRDHDKWLYKKK